MDNELHHAGQASGGDSTSRTTSSSGLSSNGASGVSDRSVIDIPGIDGHLEWAERGRHGFASGFAWMVRMAQASASCSLPFVDVLGINQHAIGFHRT